MSAHDLGADQNGSKGRAISHISTQLVALPLAEPIKHPFMGARTQKATLIVQVHTADGAVGFGYVSIESVRLVRAVQGIITELEPALKGQDVTRRNFLFERMWNMTVDLLHDGATNLALSAIDIALWDLAGKLAGMPLWRLLGGYRDEVPAYASWALWRHHDSARLEIDAAKIVEQGYKGMKLRMGSRPYAEDMARARLVRETVGPDINIMVDALWSMTAIEAVKIARGLGELGYTWLEEPVREGDFAGLAKVRAEQALPIAAGERISRLAQIETLVPNIDHAILDVAHLGGITPWLKAANAIEGHNLPLSAHSHAHVHMHLLAAVRCGAWIEFMPWLDAIFVDPPTPKNGMLKLGEKPGLGLELDHAAIERYTVK
jgi:L-alanine-DL-glutamate epimerase-like enolase superfamily enzyme